MLIVDNVDAVAFVSAQVRIWSLIVSEIVNGVAESGRALAVLVLELVLCSWSFDVTLLAGGRDMGVGGCVLLDDGADVCVEAVLGVEEAHRVGQLNDVVFELDELLALLHGHELLLLVQLGRVSGRLVETVAFDIAVCRTVLIYVLCLTFVLAGALVVKVSFDPAVVLASRLPLSGVARFAPSLAQRKTV